MKVFDSQIDLTAHFEGFCLRAYKCPADVWTIGFGETNPDGKPVGQNMVCTLEQATKWLQMRLSRLTLHFEDKYNTETLAQGRALADFAYNLGENAFPTLLKYLKAGDVQSASHEFLDGFYVNKKPLLGLLLRRISNYHTFITGEYKAWEKGDLITPEIKSILVLKNGHNDLALEMINKLEVARRVGL